MAKTKKIPISAVTGRFVKKSEVNKHPDKTVTLTVKIKPKKKKSS